MDRKERQKFRRDLIGLILGNVNDDESYFEKLIYALHVISKELDNYGGKN